MDKSITTVLLIVISMVMAMLLFNTVYPAVLRGSDAINNMTTRAEDRMRSQITIIHAAGELDNNGVFADSNGDGEFEAFIWVKNIGSTPITAIDRTDLFFGAEGNFMRIPYRANGSGGYPYWNFQFENDTKWLPTATVKISVHYPAVAAPASGRYYVKVTVLNGVSDELYFGM